MKSIKETYNDLSKAYEENVDTESPYNTDYERPAMMKEIPEQLEGVKVLDAGCAAGWYCEAFVSRGADVTGIDVSSGMVEAAKRRLGVKAAIFCHDLEEALPFQNEEFDIIVSSLTLHYIKDWGPVFQEFRRVLKPGGILLFSVHHPFMDFTRFKLEDYFKKQLLTETWTKQNIKADVSFYRRSLQEIITAVSEYLTVEGLTEPQPEKVMKDKYPKKYTYLMKNPHFLIIKSRKQ
ncbi:class I SAM-dependent methyltransferase [Virgibacillus flavescens]|uniref:class I SAM-dependent methyltransferase n=1 Tax=Virgibacillus flavescens TaxID=1611422 RepID=UPI003D32D5AB